MSYEPNSKGEERFIKKHRVDVKNYPVPNEGQEPFKPKKAKKDHSKAASYEPGEDKKVYESYEELVELSKKTLASYVSRARVDRDLSYQRGKKHDKRADDALFAGNYRKNTLEIDRAEDNYNRFHKRSNNIALANRKMKLAKEETELQELSKQTLKNYIHKSARDMGKQERRVGLSRGTNYRADRKAENRLGGITRAASKLAREETELAELSRATLKSYLTKSASNERDNSASHSGKLQNLVKSFASGDEAGAKKAGAEGDSIGKKIFNRQRGQKLAKKKLGEETDLQELSKKTLRRYDNKAGRESAIRREKAFRLADKASDMPEKHWRRAKYYHELIANHEYKSNKRSDKVDLARRKIGDSPLSDDKPVKVKATD